MSCLPFTLRQLDVFAALCATNSFREAADRLGISQASVSNQVKTLEEQLGVALLLRLPGRQPTLTAEGLAFLHDLESFHAAAQRLAGHRRASAQPKGRLQLRIRVGQGMMDNYIRPKLDSFLREHADLSLQFDAQAPGGNPSKVEAQRYDFVLLHQRADRPINTGFREVALLRGGIYGHRNFAVGRDLPLSPERLSELPFILPSEGSLQEQEVHLALQKVGIIPRTILGHTQYFDVMASMLAQGVGVASFAEVILPPSMRDDVIRLFPLSDWRLVWFRRDEQGDVRRDRVEHFLLSSLLEDPDYPTISISDDAFAVQGADAGSAP